MWPFRRKKKVKDLPSYNVNRFGSNPNDRIIDKHLQLTQQLEDAPASEQFGLAQGMLKISEEAAKAFQSQGWPKMPTHLGFRRIAVNLERQGDFQGAISACREAKRQGWSGDWDKRIERCQGKLAKQEKASKT